MQDTRIREDVMEKLALRHSMDARRSQGGTATVRTEEQLDYFKKFLKDLDIDNDKA